MIARFEPAKGTIPPKSSINIYFSMVVFIGGSIDELFICNIQDVELPLGFVVLGDAFGLNVSYEVGNSDATAAMNLSNTSSFRGSKTSGFGSMSESQS